VGEVCGAGRRVLVLACRPYAAAMPLLSPSDGWKSVTVPALAEMLGTAMVMLVGLSALTLCFSTSSPISTSLGDPTLRRLVTGTVFVATAVAVAYSPLGRRSGGHLNPSVTIGFSALGQLHWWGAALYVSYQVTGAVIGTGAVLALWGKAARSVHLGATLPGHRGPLAAFCAEAAGTFLLVFLIFHCVDRPRVMRFTPIAAGLLVVIVVVIEAPLSSTSLNPARSLGPAIVGNTFTALWIYLLATPLGALLAALVFSRTRGSVPCAKLVHTGDEACSFRHCAYREPGTHPVTL
jgi:aquaporin Z